MSDQVLGCRVIRRAVHARQRHAAKSERRYRQSSLAQRAVWDLFPVRHVPCLLSVYAAQFAGFRRIAQCPAKRPAPPGEGSPPAHESASLCRSHRNKTEGNAMKIARIEDLHCDAGWRTFSFLKITTDDGITGWSEYTEADGSRGLTAVIHGLAEPLIG